jgi:hypothetical protein
MINAQQIQDILALYTKHGWKLRRVLLTPGLKAHLDGSITALFGSAEIIDSEIDAVWLSRFSGEDRESWEIRRLSETGYALIEVFDHEDEEEVREERRLEMQAQMKPG